MSHYKQIHSHRKDSNHDLIAKTATSYGWLVFDVHMVTDFYDQIWERAGDRVYIEVKVGRNKPTPNQERLHIVTRASGARVEIVRTVDDVDRISRE